MEQGHSHAQSYEFFRIEVIFQGVLVKYPIVKRPIATEEILGNFKRISVGFCSILHTFLPFDLVGFEYIF